MTVENRAGARRPRSEWEKVVREYRGSGEPASLYAPAHGMKAATLKWWASRLGRDVAASMPSREEPPAARTSMTFLPVRVAKTADTRQVGTSVLEVVLSNGRRVRVSGSFDAEVLGRLLDVAEGVASC